MLAYPGCRGKEAVKWVSVMICQHFIKLCNDTTG